MKKHQNQKGRKVRYMAVLLSAVMAVQTALPAMASWQYDDDVILEDMTLDNSGRGVSRIASGSNGDRENNYSKASGSNAAASNAAASSSNARKDEKEITNILSNGSFEDTSTATAAWKWVWNNEIMPTGWGTWESITGNKKMSFEIAEDENEAREGSKYLRITSTDRASKIGINRQIREMDFNVEYLCTFWVKTEAVEGTGLCVRLARVKKSDNKTETLKEMTKINGTTDGWVQYGFSTKGFPSSNTAGIQIDIIADAMTGEICLDDVQVVPTYELSISEQERTLLTGDRLQLKAECSDGFNESIEWYSKDPSIAAVDEDGWVTAYKMGTVDIVAKTDNFHEISCKVTVEDGELRQYYQAIRENWKNRLTGNNLEDTSDEIYQAMMTDLTEKAQVNWDTMEKGGNEREKLWSDINFVYKFQGTTVNVTEDLGTGMSRIEQMATAYSAKGSTLYQNQDLKADIIGALEWVYGSMYNDTMSPQKDTYGNWWHWFIGMPQSLCNTVILMYDDMDPDLILRESKTLANFNWDPNERYVVNGGGIVKNEAGNLIDTSLVSALRASIGETSKPMNMAKTALDKSIGFVTSGNGYYEDGSYIDHGNLAYTGGYGSTLLGGMEKFIFIVDGSPWEVEADKLSSIFHWIWNGIRPLYADGAMMDMTTGRGVARPSTNGQTVGKGLLKPISHLADIAPEDQREELLAFAKTEIQAGLRYNEDYFIGMTVYDMAAMRNLVLDSSLEEDSDIYHKNFGVMDKSVYHGENFELGISMYSERTGNFEYGNKENRKGWHMSDGALYLHNSDQAQFADVYWPTVDAHRLPGITTDHTEGFIPSDNSWNPHSSTKDWVGGSSVLEKYGSVGMDFEGETKSGGISSLKAKKSWFTFPNTVVALGAGINSKEGKSTETIVDNRKSMEGAANRIWVDGQETGFSLGTPAVLPMSWALLEGNEGESQNIGYYFPENTEVSVLKETRTGNWRDINTAVGAGSANDKDIVRSYISFAVDHGVNPQGATYSYVLLPGRNQEEMAEFAADPQVKILSNTDQVQAVENTEYGVSGYNFWTAYDKDDLGISAKTPASVTLAKEDGSVTAGISNPTQNGKDTVIVFHGFYEKIEADEGVTVSQDNGKTIVTIKGNRDFGKTYQLVLADMGKTLDKWQEDITNASRTDKSDIKEILDNLKSLDGTQLTQEQKETIEALIRETEEKLEKLEYVDKVIAPLEVVEDVTFENADEVEILLKKYDSLTQDEAALLAPEDKEKMEQLKSGFQKEEVRAETEGIAVRVANGTLDVRTTFAMADESASMGLYQDKLKEDESLLNLFRPSLLLKSGNLSFEDHPVYISMVPPASGGNETGKSISRSGSQDRNGKTLKLYCFVSPNKKTSLSWEEVPVTSNQDGTITFELKHDSVYGFALKSETEPEIKPDSKPSNSGRRDSSDVDTADGSWVSDANGWWFRHYNGTWPVSQWKWVQGSWYHFNESGYMQTGWLWDKDSWYYLKADGSMVIYEWVLYKDKWYFMSDNGKMLSNNSVWWNQKLYYFAADGTLIESN